MIDDGRRPENHVGASQYGSSGISEAELDGIQMDRKLWREYKRWLLEL